LSLAQIVDMVVQQMDSKEEALELLVKTREKVKANDEAAILCIVAAGLICLKSSDVAGAKNSIGEAEKLIDDLPSVTKVHSRFYELSSLYYKLIGDFSQYYRHSLRFLGCTKLSDVPIESQKERAFDLCLAALLGKNVYNFGELLQHEILEALKPTDKGWLVQLISVFNAGNMEEFDSMTAVWRTQPDLAGRGEELQKKMRLMCLVELAFTRPGENRHIPFADIASKTNVDANKVEGLVMQAMSLGLIRGCIDEVAQLVHVNWVQPRVLDKNQLATMQQRLMTWCRDISNVEQMIEKTGQEIIIATQ